MIGEWHSSLLADTAGRDSDKTWLPGDYPGN